MVIRPAVFGGNFRGPCAWPWSVFVSNNNHTRTFLVQSYTSKIWNNISQFTQFLDHHKRSTTQRGIHYSSWLDTLMGPLWLVVESFEARNEGFSLAVLLSRGPYNMYYTEFWQKLAKYDTVLSRGLTWNVRSDSCTLGESEKRTFYRSHGYNIVDSLFCCSLRKYVPYSIGGYERQHTLSLRKQPTKTTDR